YPLDEHYKSRPEFQQLREIKERLNQENNR
ncbi:MAG: hypothetical protein ACI89E_001512, partial [Planctomycetota bacterium]